MTSKRSLSALRYAAALLVGLALTANAWAQTMFYREVEKDGRIYVFALMKEFEAFDKSGEMGKAITRLSYGASGQTVVFDSEDAINYYNYKHNLPGEVFAKSKEAPKPHDDFAIKVGVTIFTDYTYTDQPTIVDSDKNKVNKSEFEARRAYVNVTGNINSFIAFRITPDVAARQALTTTTTGLPAGSSVATTGNLDGSLVVRLKYAFGQFNLDSPLKSKGSWIRIGQQQTPYIDFMEQIYRYRFQGTTFTEREGFQSSADVGVSGHYNFPSDYGDVHLGYYNGDTYAKGEVNDQKSFQIRASFRPLAKQVVAKGLRFHFFFNEDHPVQDADRQRFVFTTTFEHRYINLGIDYINATDQSSATKAEVKANGWSFWVTPRTKFGLEALIRHDDLKPNKAIDARRNRTIAGLSYWFRDKAPLAACLLADVEQVKYDTLLAKPTEKRFELKALFNF
jgi:hypothetical protein